MKKLGVIYNIFLGSIDAIMGQFKDENFLFAVRQALKERRELLSLPLQKVVVDVFENEDVIINIGKIESGKDDISHSTLLLLCEYYKISISDFFQRVEEIDSELKIKRE